MSKKLADFFHKLATDKPTLDKFNAGATKTELAKNREDLMKQHGLSEDDKNAVRGNDLDAINAAMKSELGMQLDSWTNHVNSIIKVSKT